jgi:hypothetical protein
MADEKRVRLNTQSGTLGAQLTAAGTTITFAVAPDFATLASDEHIALIVENEVVYMTAYTAAATTGTVARAQEGTADVTHVNGSVWEHGPTIRDISVGRVAFATRTAGDVAVGTTFAAVDSATDLVLKAQAGDVIRVGINSIWTAAATADKTFDVATWVGGAAVSWFGNSAGIGAGGVGPAAWYHGGADFEGRSGVWFKILTSSDVDNGTVTLRVCARAGTARTLQADTVYRFEWWAENMGAQAA